MKQFLKTNTVTYNLMSYTGFKSLLIFSSLLEGAKSYKDLQTIIKNNEYLHEDVSIDAIRIYINSLKAAGCVIQKTKEGRISKYLITEHPLNLKFSDKQIKDIIKAYKAISNTLEVRELVLIQKFCAKIANYVENTTLKEKLQNISPTKNIDPKLIEDLIYYANSKSEITVYYNSSISGRKNMTIQIDKIYVLNGKLYIAGYNSEHKNYSSFLVSKIINIVSVNLRKTDVASEELRVVYEYKKDDVEFELSACEKILEEHDDKYIVEITSKNKFDIMQRILYHAANCKVLQPQDFKEYIVSNLKKMKEGYLEEM